MCRTTSAAAVAGILALTMPGGVRAEPWQYDLRTEVGGEYDSNVRRTEIIDGASADTRQDPIGSPLARLVFGGELHRTLGPSHQLSLSLTSAGKLFATRAAQDENIAVVQGGARWRMAIGDSSSLTAMVGYYDAFQAGREDARDFRSLSPTLQWSQRLGDIASFTLSGGYRSFTFKPMHDFDFWAPTAGVDLRLTRETNDLAAEWELTTGGSIEARRFGGLARESACHGETPGCGLVPSSQRQHDTFVVGHLDITRTGRFLAGAGYMVQWNQSNSFGQSLLRHAGSVRATVPLPLDLYATARLELVHVTYRDPVLLASTTSTGASFSTIEDENRNTLRVELSRPLSEHVEVIARYSLFRSAISPAHYLRQTMLVSISISTASQ